MHTDDSDVTFNMCLGRVFSGIPNPNPNPNPNSNLTLTLT